MIESAVKPAGPVTKAERLLAQTMDADTRLYQRKGAEASIKITYRAALAVLKAFKAGKKKLGPILRAELMKAQPLLREAMVISFLTGIWRMKRTRTLKLSQDDGSAYGSAMDTVKARLDLDDDELKRISDKLDTKATYVLHTASEAAEKKLQEAISDITEQGMHVKQGVMRLHEAFNAAGIMPNNSYTLENIYRTQTALAYSAGRRREETKGPVADILWGYKYVTVGDDRVRPAHQEMEGTTLPKDDEFWDTCYPPCGWSCRCVAIPLFGEQEEVDAPDDAEADDGFGFDPGDYADEVMGDSEEAEDVDEGDETTDDDSSAETIPDDLTEEQVRDMIEETAEGSEERKEVIEQLEDAGYEIPDDLVEDLDGDDE